MSNTPPPINPSGEQPIKTPPPVTNNTGAKIDAKPNFKPNTAPNVKPRPTNAKPAMPSNIKPTSPSIKPAGPSTTPQVSKSDGNKPKVNPIKVDPNSPQVAKAAQDENKKNKKKKWLLLLLLLLLLFIVIAVVIIIIETSPKKTIKIELVVDSAINIPSEPELTKEYLPGDQIPAHLKVSLTNEDVDDLTRYDFSTERVYLRYKISAYVDGNYYAGLFDPLPIQGTENNYIKGADNYFYHKNSICIADGEITIYEYLDFVEEYDNNVLNGKTVQLHIEVEILEASPMAIIQEWNTSPNLWRDIVE